MTTELVFGEGEQQPRREEVKQRREEVREERRDREFEERKMERQPRDAVEAFFGGATRTQFGGISNKTLNALIEVFDSIDTGYDDPNVDPVLSRKNFSIHPIDGQNTNPTLVIGLPTELGGEELVIYYSLVLEIPGTQMREIRRYRRDEPMELPVFSEDRMDARWKEAVKAAVSRIGPGRQLDAGYQLIPSNLLTDDANEGSNREDVLAIYSNAVDGICGFRELVATRQGIEIPTVHLSPAFVSDTRRFEASLDYSRKPRIDTSKLPIRSDIALTVYHSEHPRGQDGEQLVPTRRPIGTVSVAVDMHVSEAGEVSGWGRRRGGSDETDPFWQPVINITDIVGEPNIPWSIENSLLMIGSTAHLASNFRWVEGVRPRVGGQYKPLEELGALTLAHPDPARRMVAEDITPHTSDAELSDFLNFTVSPDVYYGMVIANGSEKSWANRIFERLAITQDSVERNALLDNLYAAADNLTNGAFADVLHERGIGIRTMPVQSIDNRVFTGYFSDSEGNLRDIREWNVPAIMTLTKDTPSDAYDIAMEYQDTLMPDASADLNHDLAERYRILKQLLGTNGFHLNGTAEMVQLQTWFVEALAEAMTRSGVMPHLSDQNGLRSRVHRASGYTGETIGRMDIGQRRRRDEDDRFDRRRYR